MKTYTHEYVIFQTLSYTNMSYIYQLKGVWSWSENSVGWGYGPATPEENKTLKILQKFIEKLVIYTVILIYKWIIIISGHGNSLTS